MHISLFLWHFSVSLFLWHVLCWLTLVVFCRDCYLVSFLATAWLSLQLLVFSVSEFSTSISYFLMILRKKALCSFLNSFRAKGKITTLICLKLGFHLSFKMLKKWIQIQNCSNYLLMSIPIDDCHLLRGFFSDQGGVSELSEHIQLNFIPV